MKKLNEHLYMVVKDSLKGDTIEDKLEDVKTRIFMNNMIDNWTPEDYEFDDVLEKIKEELESEINGKQE